MKLTKRIVLLFMGMLCVFSLASCGSDDIQEEKPDGTEQTPPTDKTDEETPIEESIVLSSISIDTSNVQQIFYLGDQFNTKGLKVTANYIKYVTNESPQGIAKECNDYYVDYSEVDMNQVGEYPVMVVFREGTTRKTANYTVSVKSSRLDDSGVKYAAGLEVQYGGNLDLLLNDEFTFRQNALRTLKVHYYQDGKEIEVKNTPLTNVKIDYSAVDTTKIGSYMIVYSFEEDLVINGETVKNVVKSFSIVTVSNPITKIEFVEGTTTIPASVTGLDVSDWKIKLTLVKGDPQIVSFTSDLFTLSGVVSFVEGTYEATVVLNEDKDIRFTKEITIVESTTHNVTLGVEFGNYKDLGDGKVQLDESGLFFATGNPKIDEARQNSNGTWKDSYGGSITFHARTTIKNSAQAIEVVMNQPGIIVVYYASTGSTVREVVLYDPSGNEVESFNTADSSAIQEAIVEVTEAGTYRIVCPADQVYIHGCIIATEKTNS